MALAGRDLPRRAWKCPCKPEWVLEPLQSPAPGAEGQASQDSKRGEFLEGNHRVGGIPMQPPCGEKTGSEFSDSRQPAVVPNAR